MGHNDGRDVVQRRDEQGRVGQVANHHVGARVENPASPIDVAGESAGLVTERQQPSADESPDAAGGADDEHPSDRFGHDGSLTFSSDLMARRSSMAA